MGDTFRLELAEGVVTGNVKVMLYGKSGAGKTFAASTCLPVDGEDFAVALVTEPNGVLSVTHGSVKTRVLIASWEETAPQVRDGKVVLYDGDPVMAPVIDPVTARRAGASTPPTSRRSWRSWRLCAPGPFGARAVAARSP